MEDEFSDAPTPALGVLHARPTSRDRRRGRDRLRHGDRLLGDRAPRSLRKLDYVVENRKQSLIDECIVVAVLSVFGLLVFSVRRMMDQQREIRLRHQAEDRAAHLALADALTGLPNRRQFESRLLASIARFSGNESAFALMMIDLDRFKPVNDVFGHGVGDQVLIAFAEARLRGRRPRSNARPLRRRRIRAPRRSDRGSGRTRARRAAVARGFRPAVRGQRNAGDAGRLDRNHSRAARRDYGGRTDAPRGYRPLSRQGHGPQHVLLLREGRWTSRSRSGQKISSATPSRLAIAG